MIRPSRALFLGLSALLLPALPACTSSGAGGGGGARAADAAGPRASVRKVDELPADHRALWQAWQEEAPDWKEQREAALADPALSTFLVENLVREWIQAYRQNDFTRPDSARLGRFERARGELVQIGAAAAPVLSELLSISSSDISDNAAAVLREIGRPAVLPVVEQLGKADLDQARMRAAGLLAELPYAGREEEPRVRQALGECLAKDPHWLVRARAAAAVGRRGARDIETAPARGLLVAALRDPDEAVGVQAVQGLALLDDPEAIPALIGYYERAIDAASIEGMRAGGAALARLTGEGQTLDARGWRDWWRDHKGELQRRP